MDILHPTAATEERRASGTMFASEVLSIPDLVRRASEIVTENATRDWHPPKTFIVPPIPSLEMVRLQFVPNNHTVASAALFTGALGVIRKVQTRTLRKQHIDQHWVNAWVSTFIYLSIFL